MGASPSNKMAKSQLLRNVNRRDSKNLFSDVALSPKNEAANGPSESVLFPATAGISFEKNQRLSEGALGVLPNGRPI